MRVRGFLQLVCSLTVSLQPNPSPAAQMTAATVSADNKVLLLGDETGTISAWLIADGRPMWVVTGTGRPIRDLSFSDADSRVLAVDGERSIRILPVGGTKGTTLQLDYQYFYANGRPARTIASAVVGGRNLVLGSSGFARAYLLSTDRLESEPPYIALESFVSREIGLGDYVHAVGTGPPSSAVMARVDYGSNPGRDEWTDLGGCPKAPLAVGTTREGYLLAWRTDTLSALPKEADLPTLKPEYQRSIGRTKGTARALTGVACGASGLIATVGEGSDRYGEVQVWSLSGELMSGLKTDQVAFHAGLGKRVAWDASGQYIATAAASGYDVWSWDGNALHANSRLSLSHELTLATGRPVVGVGVGKFILLSGEGAWLYDVSSKSLVQAFGNSPVPLRTEPPNSTQQQRKAKPTYSTFFENALRVVGQPEQIKTLSHPLFRVIGGGEIELSNGKAKSRVSFSCSFGRGYSDLIEERGDCVRNLQSKWAEFLKSKGLQLRLVHDDSLPGWTRVVIAAHRSGRVQLQYVYESETNPNETMGYAQISVLKD
jgi:hypothetical protein